MRLKTAGGETEGESASAAGGRALIACISGRAAVYSGVIANIQTEINSDAATRHDTGANAADTGNGEIAAADDAPGRPRNTEDIPAAPGNCGPRA